MGRCPTTRWLGLSIHVGDVATQHADRASAHPGTHRGTCMQQRTAWHESVPPPYINASSTAVSSLALHQAAPYRLEAWSPPVVRPRRRTLPADDGCCRLRMHSPQPALLTLLHGRMRVRKSLESPQHTRTRGVNSHVCVDAQAAHSLHVGGGAALPHSPSERASTAGGATIASDDDCWRESADPT